MFITFPVDEYIQISKEKYGYNAEQALGMLFWHKHDLDRAIQDLANFTPFPDEWTVEDKVLFEQAFQFHGKSFHRIRQMLPDKTIAQLVKYYYGWKKTRTRTSLMDRQARKLQVQREEQGTYGEEAGAIGSSGTGTEQESDNEEEKEVIIRKSSMIQLARPTVPPVAITIVLENYFVLYVFKSVICVKTMLISGRDCGSVEWINKKGIGN